MVLQQLLSKKKANFQDQTLHNAFRPYEKGDSITSKRQKNNVHVNNKGVASI